MSETINLTPTPRTPQADERPVHIQYGDVKMDLPRLDDSTQLPIDLIIAGMAAASQGWDNLDNEQKMAFMATVLAFLTKQYPKFARELDRKSGDKVKDLGLIFDAWATATVGMDPKA
ncbi:hypothetical protein [Bifidobacterium pseudolongum]|uniref:Uncharacterized protein n=1 Tax=Bifidobacterium pseudolongum subsp. globosum TaxID=1690 RepID=A0A4Q5ASS3_9BIFI|nr:hypothetical protein [Bifidobacterium pseudolongum]RYQ36628.1 hypothetical protein PG2003B_1127 [Bifidobacterium pseudolongum subsp. globosum]